MKERRRRSPFVAMVGLACLGMLAYAGCGGDQQTASTGPESVSQPAQPQPPAAPKPPTSYGADPNAFKVEGSGAALSPLGSGQGQTGSSPVQPAPGTLAGGGSAPAPDPDASRTGDNRPGVDMRDRLPKKDSPTKPDMAPGSVPQAGFEVGDLAPEIVGNDIDGSEFKLSDYRGKVVVLDFWGDW